MRQLPKDAIICGGGKPVDLSIMEKIKWPFSFRYEKKEGKQTQYYRKIRGLFHIVGIRFSI